jgi:hypothetical protein
LSCAAAMAGLGLVAALSSQAKAQATLSAGSVNVQAGQTAAVPITINLGNANVAFFGATFTVMPQGGAPAIAGKLTYQAATPPGAPEITNNSVPESLAIGYLSGISPPLTGTVVVGTLIVPIPAAATGTYQVQLSKISTGDSFGNRVMVAGQGGTITVRPAPIPTNTPPATATPTRTVTPTRTPTSTLTHTPTHTPTPTPTSTPPCVGDCGSTHTVVVTDILTLVNIALGTTQPSLCLHGVPSGAEVNVALIIQAVNNALNGCAG